jgi:hypothetical protein
VHALAHAAGVHTRHTPDCMNLVPVLLTWHSTLSNRHPPFTIVTYKYDYLGRVGQSIGLKTRHLLQLPLKHNFSQAPRGWLHRLCCHFVLKHLVLL